MAELYSIIYIILRMARNTSLTQYCETKQVDEILIEATIRNVRVKRRLISSAILLTMFLVSFMIFFTYGFFINSSLLFDSEGSFNF